MLNNEQLEIRIFLSQIILIMSQFDGILPNTSIVYIDVISESFLLFAGANQIYTLAALALKDVDFIIVYVLERGWKCILARCF